MNGGGKHSGRRRVWLGERGGRWKGRGDKNTYSALYTHIKLSKDLKTEELLDFEKGNNR